METAVKKGVQDRWDAELYEFAKRLFQERVAKFKFQSLG